MSLPIYDGGVAAGLLSGIVFGYILENAGFGSPCKLTAQFRFRDWSVFKVMFTAIVVAAVGLVALEALGVLRPNGVFVPSTFFWATLLGGVLIGAGFAFGGYCPGTSVVGFFSGRIDALVFMFGMLVGTGFFAGVHEKLAGLMRSAKLEAKTLPQLLGLSEWVVLVALVVVAVVVFKLAGVLERRLGGPLDAEEIREGAQGD